MWLCRAVECRLQSIPQLDVKRPPNDRRRFSGADSDFTVIPTELKESVGWKVATEEREEVLRRTKSMNLKRTLEKPREHKIFKKIQKVWHSIYGKCYSKPERYDYNILSTLNLKLCTSSYPFSPRLKHRRHIETPRSKKHRRR